MIVIGRGCTPLNNQMSWGYKNRELCFHDIEQNTEQINGFQANTMNMLKLSNILLCRFDLRLSLMGMSSRIFILDVAIALKNPRSHIIKALRMNRSASSMYSQHNSFSIAHTIGSLCTVIMEFGY